LPGNGIFLLESVGFQWSSVKYIGWMEMYKCLVAYKEKYNTTLVPRDWELNPRLGEWVARQRKVCKETHKVHLLNDIGFVWVEKADKDSYYVVNQKVSSMGVAVARVVAMPATDGLRRILEDGHPSQSLLPGPEAHKHQQLPQSYPPYSWTPRMNGHSQQYKY
jgi:hypothetical protein